MATYIVKPGDTLGAIASRFRTSAGALARTNGIRNVNLIHVNQRLQVPGGGNAGAASARSGAAKASRAKPGGAPGTRAWFQNVATKATARAGVPASWATSGALSSIVQRESGYRPNAQNPTSTAYGLFQFLNSTWQGTGVAKTSDPVMQTVAGLRYIKQRYGTPEAAMAFWNRNHWY